MHSWPSPNKSTTLPGFILHAFTCFKYGTHGICKTSKSDAPNHLTSIFADVQLPSWSSSFSILSEFHLSIPGPSREEKAALFPLVQNFTAYSPNKIHSRNWSSASEIPMKIMKISQWNQWNPNQNHQNPPKQLPVPESPVSWTWHFSTFSWPSAWDFGSAPAIPAIPAAPAPRAARAARAARGSRPRGSGGCGPQLGRGWGPGPVEPGHRAWDPPTPWW